MFDVVVVVIVVVSNLFLKSMLQLSSLEVLDLNNKILFVVCRTSVCFRSLVFCPVSETAE